MPTFSKHHPNKDVESIYHIPEKLIELRKALGETRLQFSDRFGIPQASLKNYEHGTRPLPLSLFLSIIEDQLFAPLLSFFVSPSSGASQLRDFIEENCPALADELARRRGMDWQIGPHGYNRCLGIPTPDPKKKKRIKAKSRSNRKPRTLHNRLSA